MSSQSSTPPPDDPPSSKVRPPSSKVRPPSSSLLLDSALGRKLRILVVDDSAICLEVTRMMLEESGYEVMTVESPFALSTALEEYIPDLVLIDVAMPGLSGDKVVAITIKHLGTGHACPIVLHSDRSRPELGQLADECGAAGYLQKTSNAPAFVSEIERFLPFPAGKRASRPSGRRPSGSSP